MTDDLDSLLNDVLGDALTQGSTYIAPLSSASITASSVVAKGAKLPFSSTADRNVDELLKSLDMEIVGSSVSNISTSCKFAASSMQTDSGNSISCGGSAAEIQCTYLCLGPSDAPLGSTRSLVAKRVCPSQRCTNCDFNVLQMRDGAEWDSEADYLFFRNVFPDTKKLSARLRCSPGAAAYCCQCSWVSVLPSDGTIVVRRPGGVVPIAGDICPGRVGGLGWTNWFCSSHKE